jgi:hypothetical protein
VDGKHHYTTGRLADPSVYAATMRGDRELKLARYDVMFERRVSGRPRNRANSKAIIFGVAAGGTVM